MAGAFMATLLCVVMNGPVLNYEAMLSGSAELPAMASPGTGTAMVSENHLSQTLLVDVVFPGMTVPQTAAPIHAAVART